MTDKCVFEVGKTYKTRGGLNAKVVDINFCNGPESQITAIVVVESGKSFSIHYNIAGNRHYVLDTSLDLIPPEPEKKVVEFWVNVYPSGHGFSIYRSKYEADRGCLPSRIACLHIKQEFIEGEGLEKKDLSDGFE